MEPEQPIPNGYPSLQEMAIPIPRITEDLASLITDDPSLHPTIAIFGDPMGDTKEPCIRCDIGIEEETKKVTISFDIQIDGSHYESQINLTFDKTSGLITRLKNIENTINMKQRLAANAYRTASGQEFIENL